MKKSMIVTAVLAGGLAFGIAVPAQAAEAACTVERVLVSSAVDGSAAVYGDAAVLTPARAPWIERVLVSAAVTEVSHTVHHPAKYVERVVVDRAAVPAVPAVDEISHIVHHAAVTNTVHHPAITKTVSHPAVTKTVHHAAVITTDYTRYAFTGGGKGPSDGETPMSNPDNWQANGKKYDGSKPGIIHQGNGNASYFYWAAVDVVTTSAWDETVTVSDAWDETVIVTAAWDEKIVTPAWDEKVIDVAAQPGTAAQPEISHIERDLVSAAYDETVIDVEEQDAVYTDVLHPAEDAVFGEPELITAAVPATPAVYIDVENCSIIDLPVTETPVTETPVTEELPAPTALPVTETASGAGATTVQTALAVTGGGVAPIIPVGAAALIAGGLAGILLRRRARRTAND